MPRADIVVVDGYNVIHAVPRYATEAERDLDAARARLVADVAAWAGSTRSATIVFDAAANPSSDGVVHRTLGVDVIFSPYGHEADSVVEELVSRWRGTGLDVLIVTSDSQSQWVALGSGAHRMSSAQFGREIADMVDEHTEAHAAGRTTSTIGERINPRVRDALSRWARGEGPPASGPQTRPPR